MKRVTLGRFAFQYRTKAEWEASQLILYAGELAVEGDTGLMKVGDGKHLYSELPYFNRGEKGDKGVRGEKGETGAALAIKGTKNSTSDLPKTGQAGDAYMIGGDLYVWSDTTWTNVGRVKGEKGDRGEPGQKGDPPKLTISDAGTWVVEGVDTGKKAMGPKGEQGDIGEPGPRGLPLRYDDMTTSERQDLASMIKVDLTPYAKKEDLPKIPDLSPYAKKEDIKTKLADLEEDSDHRTVTDTQKEKIDAIPADPKYTDTKTTINGKTGEIKKEDIEALGVGELDVVRAVEVALSVANGDRFFGEPTGLRENIKTLYNIDLGNGIHSYNDLVASGEAMSVLVNHPDLFNLALRSHCFVTAMANSANAMGAVAKDENAMVAVANSINAFRAIANSRAAMQAIGASDVAVTTLANSPIAKVSSGREAFSDGYAMILLGTLFGHALMVQACTPDHKTALNASGKRSVKTNHGTMYVSLDRVPYTFTSLTDYDNGKLVYIPIY